MPSGEIKQMCLFQGLRVCSYRAAGPVSKNPGLPSLTDPSKPLLLAYRAV
jgi:hypothetical protein